MMRLFWRMATLAGVTLPTRAWAQERTWEEHWEPHPLWRPFLVLATGLVLLILFGWALLSLAPAILGIVGAGWASDG